MKTKHLAWLSIIVLPLMGNTCWSCEGDEEEVAPLSESLTEFRRLYGPQQQSFSTSSDVPYAFTGKQGTEVSVPANAYHFINDNTAYTGPVNFVLQEITDKLSLLLSGTSTHSDNRLLQMQGIIWLNVFRPYNSFPYIRTPVEVALPARPQPADTVLLFHGYHNSTYNGIPDQPWTVYLHPDSNKPVQAPLTAGMYPAAVVLATGGWFGFVESWPAGTTFSPISNVTSNNPHINGTGQPELYVVLDNRLSMLELNSTDGLTHSSGIITVPEGLNAHLIGIDRINGRYYFGKTPFITGQGTNLNVTLNEVSEHGLVLELEAL